MIHNGDNDIIMRIKSFLFVIKTKENLSKLNRI